MDAIQVVYSHNDNEANFSCPQLIEHNSQLCTHQLDAKCISASVFEICPLFRCKIQNSKTITLNEHGVVNLDEIKN